MFRHILKLNPTIRTTRRIIADAHLMHQAVMAGFDHHLPERDFMADGVKPHPTHRADHHILHAVDHRDDGTVWVMVQADIPGNWDNTRLADALVEPTRPIEHTPAHKGNLHYQLVANPTIKRERGSRQPLTNPSDIENWWRNKAEKIGLDLTGDRVDIHATGQLHSRTKPGLRLATARIGGAGTVVNEEKFSQALTEGVGRGKAYGCGLLLTLPGR